MSDPPPEPKRPALEPLKVYVGVVEKGEIADKLVAEALAVRGEGWSHLEDPPGRHHFTKPWDGQPVDPHPREAVEALFRERDPEGRHVRVTGPR